jgi:hypothetical protein
MKKIRLLLLAITVSILLSACGEPVEIEEPSVEVVN